MSKPPVASASLQPGQICAFYDKEHFYHGVIVTISNKAVQVCSETGDLLNLSPARLVILSETIFDFLNPSESIAHFVTEVQQNIQMLAADTIWQQLKHLNQELTLQEIAAICSLPDNDVFRFALFTLLRKHSSLFRHKGEGYFALSEEESQAVLKADKEHALELEYRQKIEQWIMQIFAGKSDTQDIDEEMMSRLESELSLHSYTKPLIWLNHIFHKLAPDVHYYDSLTKLRIALGQIDEHTDRFLAKSGLPVLFPANVTKAATLIKPYKIGAGRFDFTEVECWTIDADESNDLDDAISIEKTAEGWQLGIHISDVTYFVQQDSTLDKEALKRTSSIYLPEADIHMLPGSISCQLASLQAGSDKPVLSLICSIGPDYRIISGTIMLSAIRVHKRFSYDKFEEFLSSESTDNIMNVKVSALEKIVAAHLQQRINQGARIVTDVNQSASRRLIAECMVIYNSRLADYAKMHNLPFYYRYLEDQMPEQDDLEIAEAPNFPSSVLSIRPLAHQAMGLAVYAQLTSPLRRYADLVNQRQIISCLAKGNPVYDNDALINLIPHLTHTRQIIRLVTQQADRYKKLSQVEAVCQDKTLDAVVIKQRRNVTILQLPDFNCRIQSELKGRFINGTKLTIKIKLLCSETGLATVEILGN